MDNKKQLADKLLEIEKWCDAYPVDIFPELTADDFKKIHNILKESGYTLDRISASNFRRVLKGVKNIINKVKDGQ